MNYDQCRKEQVRALKFNEKIIFKVGEIEKVPVTSSQI